MSPRTVQAQPAAVELTAAETRYLAAYRSMDDEGREDIVRIAENFAQEFPRRNAPVLRVLTGGRK